MVAALVASVAGLLMLRQQRALQQLEIRKDTTEARAATWSVLQLVRLTLRDDAKAGLPDHQLKPWTVPIPEIKIENGAMSGRMIELNGRFNLANLLDKDRQIDPLGVAAYQKLLANLGLSADLADHLVKHLQSKAVLENGKNKIWPLVDINELSQIDGYSRDIVRQLEPSIVALPVATTLNLNFVSAEVLAAWVPTLSVSAAEQALSKRRSQYFNNVAEFSAQLPKDIQVPAQILGVHSQFFWADVGARFGHVFLQHRILLDRSKTEMPAVLWIRRI